ncbi:hypothetical protein CTRI78_v010005 [Colletotrichum trifolii]|uniref:Uncharacterized protein n=1 Tax=Colletotrichum trifolii TaxID=5466 RepID=A0A4R8QWS3_COLTR|nr:hypothetical protein CTRI78_v010005 [Colletotrichum trifolii]
MEKGSGNSDGSPGVSSTAAAEFLRASQAVLRGEFEREEDRLNVLEAAYEIAGKVETPWDTYVRLLLNNPAVPACLKVLKDLKLFARWDELELGNEPMTSAELAGPCREVRPGTLANPVDGTDTVFQRARDYEGDLWSYLREHPEWSEKFNMILDDERSQLKTSAIDMVMMVFLAGRERTEKQWLALVESAGLKAVKFWKKPPDCFSVIELELP